MSSSDSDSDVVEQDLPSAAECEERCQRFAEVTGTDTALAMFFLQDRHWILDQALNAFYEQSGGASQSAPEARVVSAASSAASSAAHSHAGTTSSNKGPGEGKGDSKVNDPEPHRIRVLSWNIDGLSQGHLKQRTKAVIDTIKKEKVEVALLQEVVGKSEEMLRECLGGEYQVLPAGTPGREGYYSAVLLHKSRVMLDDFCVAPFLSSMMGRNILAVNCCVKGVPMAVMTSHLESTQSHAAERKRQLQTAFTRMKESPADRTVLFGGDLNLRDKELVQLGGLPRGITDLWEATGSRPEARYTWDTFRNDNLGSDHKWRAKHRFDRLYLRQRSSSSASTSPSSSSAAAAWDGATVAAVKAVYFELVGLERLEGVRCFPSDHWGLLTHLDILASFDK